MEKYGFGASTMWFSQDEVGPDLVGAQGLTPSEPIDDPNEENIDAMTDQEREAYLAALYGEKAVVFFDETMSEEELAEEESAFQPGGCQGEAVEQEPDINAFYLEYGDELQELNDRVRSDPRIVELEQEVSDCVAEQGLTYTSVQEHFEEFLGEMLEIEQMVPFQPRELSPEALEMLADLQAREIELAMAANECGGGFQNQEDFRLEVRAEYEQEFLDEHQDELAEYENAAGGE